MIPRDASYNIYDLIEGDEISSIFDTGFNDSTPNFQNSFYEGLSPSAIGSGGLVSQVTMESGYLRSANYSAGVAGWQILPSGDVEFNEGDFRGTVEVGSLHVPDQDTTANSMHVATDGDTWWGATETSFNADNNNATAYILNTGVAKFQNVNIDGASSTIAGRDIAGFNTVVDDGATPAEPTGLTATSGIQYVLLEWDKNSETDMSHYEVWRHTSDVSGSATKIADIKTTFMVDGGLTGGTPYYYWIKAVDHIGNTSGFNTGTTTATPRDVQNTDVEEIAADKILIDGAVYLSNWRNGTDATKIDGGNIYTNTVVADAINVVNLAAISADLGTITAASVTVGTSGYVRGGATGFETGTGFWLGYDTSAYKLHIGNPSSEHISWDGSGLSIVGTQNVSKIFTAAETVASGDAVRITLADNEVVDSSNDTTDWDMDDDPTKMGTKYTVGSSDEFVNYVIIKGYKTGSPGNLTLNLRDTSITGTILATDTIAEASIPSSSAEITFSFDKIVKLTASTAYYIEVVPASPDASNYVSWRAGSTGGGVGTKNWRYESSTWNSYDLPNLYTKIGIDDGGTAGRIKKAKAVTDIEAQLFRGFAGAAITSGSSGPIIVAGAFTTSGLSLTKEYYLSDTAGAIATTAGTNTKKVGLPLSTTELLLTSIW